MKQAIRRILILALLVFPFLLVTEALGENASAYTEYTDEQGTHYRVVPLGGGRYELWRLIVEDAGTEKSLTQEESGPGSSSGESVETVTENRECEHLVWAWGSEGIRHPQFHWKECLVCGKTFPPEPHVYDQVRVIRAATCTENAVLERRCACGRVDPDHTAPVAGDPEEYFAHHTWGNYESDEFSHWRFCTVCGEKSFYENHTVSGLVVEKEPTCLLGGVVRFDCGICGHHLSGVDVNLSSVERYPALKAYAALGHDFSGGVKYLYGKDHCTDRAEGSHAVTCLRCGTADWQNPMPHTWQEYTVSNGTCEDPNDPVIIGGTCACGATLKLTYERHHLYVKDSSRDVQPTCVEPGKLNGERCVYCGIFGNYEFAQPLGHDMYDDETREPIPATCETEGTVFTSCFRCDAPGTRATPKRSPEGHHVFVKYAPLGDAGVCLGSGSYMMKCKYCDTFQSDERIQVKKLAHDTYEVKKKDGGEIPGTTRDGTPMVGQSWIITIHCRRCHQVLGTEYRTVWKSLRGNRFQIFNERRKIIDDLDRNTGATVVTGQMGRDKGTYFENQVNDALYKSIRDCLKNYEFSEGKGK